MTKLMLKLILNLKRRRTHLSFNIFVQFKAEEQEWRGKNKYAVKHLASAILECLPSLTGRIFSVLTAVARWLWRWAPENEAARSVSAAATGPLGFFLLTQTKDDRAGV